MDTILMRQTTNSEKNSNTEMDLHWMNHALMLAKQARSIDEVPVGAVVVYKNTLIGSGFNQPIASKDPTAHAEIIALREAANKLNNYRLTHSTLYVTLEPCAMCAGAMVHARVQRLVYGAKDNKFGAAGSVLNIVQEPLLNHRITIEGGILAEPCAHLLLEFFRSRR